MLPPRDDPSFASELRLERTRQNLSHNELARMAGISKVMPARYENGVTPSQRIWDVLNAALFPVVVEEVAQAPLLATCSIDELIAELKRRGAVSITIAW